MHLSQAVATMYRDTEVDLSPDVGPTMVGAPAGVQNNVVMQATNASIRAVLGPLLNMVFGDYLRIVSVTVARVNILYCCL